MKMLNDNTQALFRARSPEFAPISLVGRKVSLWVFIPTGDLTEMTELGIRVSSTAGGGLNYHTFETTIADLVENAWQKLDYRIRADESSSSQGSPNLAAIVNIQLRCRLTAADGTTIVYWDDIRSLNDFVNCRITNMSKSFESHVWDLTAIEVLETGLRT